MSAPRTADALALAAEALASECGCAPSDFAAAGVRVVERPPPRADPRARRYPPWDPSVAVISFGPGAVVSASAPILREVEEAFADADREGAFAPDRLARAGALLAPFGVGAYGPFPRLVCGADRWRARPAPAGVTIALETNPTTGRIDDLGRARFAHAFSPNRRAERPTRVLALARADGEIVGAASAAEDSDTLWQIGRASCRERVSRCV